MVHYESRLTTLTADQLAAILIEPVIRDHGLSDSIVIDQKLSFIFKFWSSLCYYFNVKSRLITDFHPQTNRQTKRQNSTMKVY